MEVLVQIASALGIFGTGLSQHARLITLASAQESDLLQTLIPERFAGREAVNERQPVPPMSVDIRPPARYTAAVQCSCAAMRGAKCERAARGIKIIEGNCMQSHLRYASVPA